MPGLACLSAVPMMMAPPAMTVMVMVLRFRGGSGGDGKGKKSEKSERQLAHVR